MATYEAERLTPAEEVALELIGQLPLAAISHLLPLALGRSRSALCSDVAHLVERGLVAAIDGPPRGACRHRRLLLLTNLGLAVLGTRHGADPRELARRHALRRGALEALIRQLPAVLSSYELLALLAGVRGRKARLQAWHRPWRAHTQIAGAMGLLTRVTSLPAYARLDWDRDNGQEVASGYVLVADTGGLPPQALRSQLARLARLQILAGTTAPVVAIATTSDRRVEAWAAVLNSLSSSPSRGWLDTCIHTWDTWRSGRIALARINHDERLAGPAPVPSRDSPPEQHAPWASVPRPIDLARVRRAVGEWQLGAGAHAVLDIIGRHPFLPPATVGEVLGRDVGWARQRRSELVRRGLVQLLTPDELPAGRRGEDDPLEATVRGLTLLAGSLGLSLAGAVRHHGLAGGGRQTPVGARRALLAYAAHTLGADNVFATIARAADRKRDGSLLEWRNAAACARGRVRPDGYGLLRLGRREHGFFLEFDRGTVHAGALRAKFAAYHRYKASAAAARDYDGFPTILVVTTGPGGERRIVDAVRAAAPGLVSSLPVRVTTLDWMESDSAGPFGSIWTDPERGVRSGWPE
jgi:hypothetical protein